MASSSQQAERFKVEQIVVEFFAKSLHIILESRIPFVSSQIAVGNELHESLAVSSSLSSCLGSKAKDRWFNLILGECSAAEEAVEPWRRSITDPMVLDILLVQQTGISDSSSAFTSFGQKSSRGSSPARFGTPEFWNAGATDGHSVSQGCICGTVLERWVIHYERRKRVSGGYTVSKTAGPGIQPNGNGDVALTSSGQQHEAGVATGLTSRFGRLKEELDKHDGSSLTSHALEVPVIYKRAVIMMRSLYCTVRTLPAHCLFRLASSSSECRSFTLGYRVSASPPVLEESDEATMMTCMLTPVETPAGRMCISVTYRHTTAVTALEITPPILPRIISDYVGSPTTDPLRKLSSGLLTGSVPSGGISGRRGVHVVSLPSSVPSSPSAACSRRHSWSGGINNKTQAALLPPGPPFHVSRSPSPSDPSDQRVSPPQIHSSSHYLQSPRNHLRKSNISQPLPVQGHRRSPSFSPSHSPSPPSTQENNLNLGVIRACSAPVSIPKSSLRTPRLTSAEINQNQQHGRNTLPPPSPRNKGIEHLSPVHCSNTKFCQGQALNRCGEVKNVQRLSISNLAESLLMISPPHPYYAHQIVNDEKVEDGPPSGVKRSLYGSPRITFSRSSSKTSNQDEAEEEEFACPFAVDDDEGEEYHSRFDSSDLLRDKIVDPFSPLNQYVGLHHRSHDAAVGALVRVLKTAAPLRTVSIPGPDLASQHALGIVRTRNSPPIPSGLSLRSSFKHRPADKLSMSTFSFSSTALHSCKTASEALNELKNYIEMRDFLLMQSGRTTES